MHLNELKIGNSNSASERAKNMIKIGDGSYIQIGEWEADNLLSFKANKYNFTNGYVGIGVTSPTVALDVNGEIKTSLLFSVNGLSSSNANNLYLRTNGTSRMIILNSNGNVGVGTMNPSSKLHVVGKIQSDSLIVYSSLKTNSISGNSNYGMLKIQTDYGTLNLGPRTTDYTYIETDRPRFWFNKPIHIDGGQISAYSSNLSLQTNTTTRMTILSNNGNVGIGTSSPDYKLDVVGAIRSHEVLINTQKTADFVFSEDYKLRSLQEVEQYIVNNKHLPEIPSDSEVKENGGVNLGEMQVKLLQKIEELTLYMIRQDTTIRELKAEIKELKNK